MSAGLHVEPAELPDDVRAAVAFAINLFLVAHDLFGKPASTLRSSPRAGFFSIML